MKNKIPLLFILSLVAINLLSGSCKKGNNSNIPHLLTNGSWQLATIQVTNYIGDTQISIDTLNDSCKRTEFLLFILIIPALIIISAALNKLQVVTGHLQITMFTSHQTWLLRILQAMY